MTFGINTWNMRRVSSYEEADHYFNKTKKPRSSKWSDNARPLRDTRSTHMAIVAGEHLGIKCYDLYLYSTPLIRYFEPNADGEHAIWLQNYNTNSSQRFMWAHGWGHGSRITDQNDTRCCLIVPCLSPAKFDLWDDDFSAKIVLDSKERLIRHKSAHLPMFRRSSTSTMRARRKALKQKIEVMLTLLEMQFTELIDQAEYDMWKGQPFDSGKQHTPLLIFATRAVQMLEQGGEPDPDDLTRLMEYFKHSAKEVIRNTINRRLLQKYRDDRRWHSLSDDAPPEQGMFRDLTLADREMAAPTQTEVCKAVAERAVTLAGLHADSRVPLPQFPEEMPRSWYGPGNTPMADLLGADLYHKLTSRKGVVY